MFAGSLAFAGLAAVPTVAADAPAEPPKAVVDPYQRPSALHGVPKALTLYQYEVCPYCCKVKAALDYYKLPYEVIEVNPLTKKELKWSSYKKVPVLMMDGEAVVESTVIMSRLAAEVEGSSSAPLAASTTKSQAAGSALSPAAASERELQWRKWVDDRLVKVITANIYRSWDESFASFRYITTHTNWGWGTREAARISGAMIMWQVGKRLPKKYSLEGDLREILYADCNAFIDAMGSSDFLGGAAPNLADLAVFGVLRAIEGTPTFDDTTKHSRVASWYQRMATQCVSGKVAGSAVAAV
ncbi:MAG: hypothetical protein WDW36_005950 [Sanguina aurantia]